MAFQRFKTGETPDIKDIKKNDPFLTVLEDMVLEYVGNEENFNSTQYDTRQIPEKNSGYFSVFQNRLPVITLLQHAIHGEYKEVDAMLTKNALLLLEADTVVDYSHRKHLKRTVYQLALGAKDSDLKANNGEIVVDGMITMIERHFSRLPNKTPEEIAAIMQQQYNGQYPANYKAIEAKQDACDNEAFDAVMTVIKKANNDLCESTNALEDKIHTIWRSEKEPYELKNIIQSIYKAENNETFTSAFDVLKGYLHEHKLMKSAEFNFSVLEAIYRFRNHWESKITFTIGKHFNHKTIDKAVIEYDTNYDTFGAGRNDRWNAPKNILCWQKILGYLERFLPTCDAQVISQGTLYVIKQSEKSRRTLGWRYEEGHYYPLDLSVNWELGYNYAAGAGLGIPNRGAGTMGKSAGMDHYRNLCQAKIPLPTVMQWQDKLKNHCVIL